MKTTARLCGLAVITAMTCASAKEFPLEFKTLDAKESMSLPGGWVQGTILRASPRPLKSEPKPLCRRPVYGQLGDAWGNEGMLFVWLHLELVVIEGAQHIEQLFHLEVERQFFFPFDIVGGAGETGVHAYPQIQRIEDAPDLALYRK